ncbi:GH25 family lysozyme, partial [Streptomyces sp. NPDC088353]|uniref:GH25 family lysozyme n=1 Tax=Streptomyces sp. NPDC088353 TaxID=3365855 RepID=UPI0037F7D2AA
MGMGVLARDGRSGRPVTSNAAPARGSASMGVGVVVRDGRGGTPVTRKAAPARGSAYMGMGVLAHDGRSGMPVTRKATRTEGVDVSSYDGNVAWSTLWSSGVKWADTKATEGTYYTNPYFKQQYKGSYNVGMIRGAYHFATPDTSSGAK